MRARKNAVTTQQRRIDQLGSDLVALETQTMTRRKEADQLELELKVKEEEVAKFRAALNTARTNKEYAAILTHINTRKADNAKFEERALNILQDVDAVKAQAEQVREQIGGEQKQLAEIERISAQEIERLTGMMEELSGKRSEAVKAVLPKALAVFERLAISYDGEAMAHIEIQGKRPPYEYHCGGCYMSLSAEHANVLRVRDEVRNCPNCGRILYFKPTEKTAKK